MRRTAWIVLLAAAACRVEPVAQLAQDWTVDPASVRFEDTVVGVPKVATLTVQNRSAAPVELDAAAPPPFSVAPAHRTVPGGSSAAIAIVFDARAEGDATGVLTLRSDDAHEQQVPLVARARAASCPPARECQQAVIGPDGTCASVAFADGHTCQSACLLAPACLGGVCAGTARDCSDGDACTADSCDAATGCAHAPLTCPASADPCQVAACDPRRGCVLAPAVDGTSCGTSDCTTSHVCVAGGCVTRPTPEGVSCGQPSPCQPLGTCQRSQCVRAPVTDLLPEWTYVPPLGGQLDVPGIADPQGNLYWVEGSASGSRLVSATSAGQVRYRQPLVDRDGLSYSTYGDFLLTGSTVVLASVVGDLLEAHDASTGALLWTRALAATVLLPGYQLLPGCSAAQLASSLEPSLLRQWSLVSDGAGRVAVSITVFRSCLGTEDTWLVSLDASSGLPQWSHRFAATGAGLGPTQWVENAFDEAGNLTTLLHYPTLADSAIVSFSATGSQRWFRSTANTTRSLLGLASGRLLVGSATANTQQIELSTGAVREWMPTTSRISGMVDASRGLILSTDPGTGAAQLLSIDFASGSATGQSPALGQSNWLTQPMLTARGSFLVASQGAAGPVLNEFAVDGTLKYACRLSSPALDPWAQPSLRHSHWVVSYSSPAIIESFALPGAEPAPSGWVTRRGKVTQEGRPR